MYPSILIVLIINFTSILLLTNGQFIPQQSNISNGHSSLIKTSSQQQQQQPQVNFFSNSTSDNFLDDRNIRLSQDKREILQYLNTKNVVKTMLKLLFGTNEESMVTSRQVLNVFVKMLEVLKSSFGQRARSTSTTSRLRDTMDNAAQAGISMVQGYVKSVLATDKQCMKRSICEGASNAARESRELGNLIAQLGG
ncbi:hypothetical protein BLA29_010457 [Euroglyphus maynei]|uniref:Uncharacterized protein n=1 Tax=Euroglyphus maynei TaxID=6958 RepID=A0A1Y3BDC2_EURMA|nr:hypothetical protein BLA29_010457 [Euroglyphus maynei]